MVNVTEIILSGFFTGIGVGLANWIFLKRLETIEKKLQKVQLKVPVISSKPKKKRNES